ncbi:MAG: BACON domain-containing protein [Rikenellaceae bacterium]
MKKIDIFGTFARRTAATFALASALLASSCEESGDMLRGTEFYLENIEATSNIVSSSLLGFEVAAEVGDSTLEIISYDIRTDAKWSVESTSDDCDWLNIYPTSGSGDSRVRFSISDNTALESRSTTLHFTYGDGNSTETTLLVTQSANVPYFEVLLNSKSVNELSTGSAATEYSVTVNSNIEYFYDKGNSDWMSFTELDNKGNYAISIDEYVDPTALIREQVVDFTMVDESYSSLDKSFVVKQDVTPYITISGSELIVSDSSYELPGFDAITPVGYTITVASNTNWEFSYLPDWITVTPSLGLAGGDYTVTITASDNYSDERYSELVITTNSVLSTTAECRINISQYSVVSSEVLGDFEGLPINWFFSGSDSTDYAADTEEFVTNNKLMAESGEAYISYYHTYLDEDGNTDSDCVRLLGGTGQPYVTGAWPGDYWEFVAPVKNLPRSSTVRFKGVSRISGTGMRYWRLQYLDSTWKDACDTQSVTFNGVDYTYTHDIATSNMEITADVVYRSSIVDGDVTFRLYCVANCTSTNGTHANPNGGTIRFASSEDVSYTDSPSIIIVE